MTKLTFDLKREYVPMTEMQERGMRLYFAELRKRIIEKLIAEGKMTEPKPVPFEFIPIDLDAPEYAI